MNRQDCLALQRHRSAETDMRQARSPKALHQWQWRGASGSVVPAPTASTRCTPELNNNKQQTKRHRGVMSIVLSTAGHLRDAARAHSGSRRDPADSPCTATVLAQETPATSFLACSYGEDPCWWLHASSCRLCPRGHPYSGLARAQARCSSIPVCIAEDPSTSTVHTSVTEPVSPRPVICGTHVRSGARSQSCAHRAHQHKADGTVAHPDAPYCVPFCRGSWLATACR